MLSPQSFDCIVIGAGQGGALARMLAEAGQKVAIIEKEAVGGTCVNRGCTPTKSHVSAAKRAHDARTAGALGIDVENVHLDLKRVVKRSRDIVESFRSGVQKRLEGNENVELIMATARFVAAHIVETRDPQGNFRHLTAPRIVIATGTRAQSVNIAGLEQVPHFDHRSLLQLEEIPEKLLVIGGGYIACEFAQMFRRFGSKVTIAERGSHLLGREDDDVAEGVADVLRAEGIEILFDSQAKSIEKTAEGFICQLQNGKIIAATHLLVAAGMQPNTDALNLEVTEVCLDKQGHIRCDDYLQAAPGIWALGDVKGGPAFTHISYDDARILADIFQGHPTHSIKERPVPYCVFTDPQLGRIGLSEAEARKERYKIQVAKIPVSDTARGIETGEDQGFLKAIVDSKTGQILGGAFLCRDGGELIAVLQVAMQGKLPYSVLRENIFAHPTFAESLNNLFLAMDRESKSRETEICRE